MKGELLALVREDARIEDVALAVALPGEKTRITGIRDIVEPRCKVSGGGQIFAGVLGAVEDLGAGRTHRLSGMTRGRGGGVRRDDPRGYDGAAQCDPRHVGAWRGGVAF